MSDANITQSFIEMVKAYEAKPELEQRIINLQQDVDFFERNLRNEEDTSRNLRAEIERLNASLSEVKTQRDDAMFRNLELEELKDKIGTLAGQLLGSLKQSDPQPSQVVSVSEPERLPEAAGPIMSQSEPEPFTDAHPVWKPIDQVSSESMIDYPSPIDPVVVEPQPEPTPTNIEPLQPSLNPSEPDGWERGKPYSHKPWYMSDLEWHDRGGLIKPARDWMKHYFDDEILF